MSKRLIFLIGCTGFLGGRLVELMMRRDQFNCRLLTHSIGGNGLARAARFPIEIVHGDIGSYDSLKESMKGAAVVVNGAYCRAGKNAVKRSIIGTNNIMRAARKCGVEQVIHISSTSIFAGTHLNEITEGNPYIKRPDNYVKTKIMTELEALREAKSASSPSLTIIRPTRIYGPYSSYWTERILRGIINTQEVLIEECIDNPANFVYVDDVCLAIIGCIMNPDAYSEDFNVNGSDDITWGRLMSGLQSVIDGSRNPKSVKLKAIVQRRKKEFRRMIPNSISAIKAVLLKEESLKIFRKDLLISTLYRSFIGKYRSQVEAGAVGAGSANSQIIGTLTPVLDQPNIDTMGERAYISNKKIGQVLGYTPQFGLDKSIELIKDWATHFGVTNKAKHSIC